MIQKATIAQIDLIAALALKLWPEHTLKDLIEELAPLTSQPEAAIFLAFDQDTPVGFAQCQLRHDYVEGTDSSPVGYLEGIYIEPACRRQGFAKALLAACEQWAFSQGCREFASDCELTNTMSLAFHLGAGFAEANRVICFTKTICQED